MPVLADWLLDRWPAPLDLAGATLWLPTRAAGARLRDHLVSRGARLLPAMRTYAWDAVRDGPLPGPDEASPSLERLAWHAAAREASARLGSVIPPRALAGRQAQDIQALVSRLIAHEIPPEMMGAAVPAGLLRHWRLTADLVTMAWEIAETRLSDQGLALCAATKSRGQAELARRMAGMQGPQVGIGPVDAAPGQLRILEALVRRPDSALVVHGTPEEQPLVRQLLERLGIPGPRGMVCRALLPSGISMVEVEGPMEEVRAIGRAVRKGLADGAAQVAIVCPDAALGGRVTADLRADGVDVRTADGLPLAATLVGQLIGRVLAVLSATARVPFDGQAPLALASLGSHALVRDAVPPCLNWAAMERQVWRGVVVRSWEEAAAKAAAAGLGEALGGVVEIFAGPDEARPMHQWQIWLEASLDFLAPDWRTAWGAGECLCWMEAWASDAVRMDGNELAAWSRQDMDAWRVPYPDTSSCLGQVALLAPKDAALLDHDLLVLAGLNEGSWPMGGEAPMLSAAMLERLGLPGPASRDALAAHDWRQFLHASPRLVVTRARMQGEAETVPSRFWTDLARPEHLAAGAVYRAEQPLPAAPTPTLGAWPGLAEMWPRTWSASWTKAVMDCPYKAVGERLMKLEELEPFGALPDKATSGTLVHGWVEAFWQQKQGWPAPWEGPLTAETRARAEERFLQVAQYGLRQEPPLVQRLWAPRVPRLAAALVGEWIKDAAAGRRPELLETWLSVSLGAASVGAQADRIDRVDNGLVVVDYKTGQVPTWKAVGLGRQPQLPLEALILAAQEDYAEAPVVAAEYWQLRGYGLQPVIRQGRSGATLAGWVEEARQGLARLMDTLDASAPYPATPEPEDACAYCALAGVCRRREASA